MAVSYATGGICVVDTLAELATVSIPEGYLAYCKEDGKSHQRGASSWTVITPPAGSGSETFCAGNDSRLSDARTPTAHKTSHQDGGSDEVALDASQITTGVLNHARLGTGGGGSTKYLREDATWQTIAGGGDVVGANNLSDVGSAATSFGNIKQAATTTVTGVVELATDGESAANLAVQSNDTRLSNARAPTAHKTTHVAGGSDIVEAFPIGSVFIAVVSTSPATLLGYGTWSAIAAGRVLVGLDAGDPDFDTAEETGGAKTHTLTTPEIPAHTHVQDSHNHTQNAHDHVLTQLRDATTGGATTNIALTADTSSTLGTKVTGSTTATNQAATATNQNAGGGGAHNNVQPYFVVYMWKRTA